MAGVLGSSRKVQQVRALLLATALTGCALDGPALAAPRVEKVPPVSARDATVALPGLEHGSWRTRTQLVWDDTTQKLTRRTYTFWDPLASRPLDFIWMPEVPGAGTGGPISGKGRLVWRLRGAPSYDEGAQVAEYRGEMRAGRAEGEGEYLHRSGVSYKGAWRAGLMDGEGRLFLPNGDQYVGGFREGRLHGAGTYIDATGTVYEGGFVAGLRDGKGLLRSGRGLAYRAVWKGGEELPGSRETVTGLNLGRDAFPVQYDELPDVRIGVLVEREPTFNDDAVRVIDYIAESDDEKLNIFPNSQRLLDVWRGNGKIQLDSDESFEYHHFKPSFLGSIYRYEAVSVIFELENAADIPLTIVGAFLDVVSSRSDLDPAVHLSVEDVGQCTGNSALNSPRFELGSYGWSDPENARIRISLTDPDGRAYPDQIVKEIGTLSQSMNVDLAPDLSSLGVDIDYLGRERLACSQGEWANADFDVGPLACLDAARQNAAFGPLGGYLSLKDVNLGIWAKGSLEYDWRDVGGSTHAKSSPFSQWIPLATLEYDEECGEGGAPENLSIDTFIFDLDREDYRISMQMNDEVPPGVTGRWRIILDAPKASEHDFRIVLQLADGQRIASRPIDLLYFKPSR